MRRLWGCLPLLLVGSLVGCAGNYAPVVDYYGDRRAAGSVPVTRGVHVVSRGETLYSIAWRHGRDYRELAAANNIRAPYTIYPGQEIRLDTSAARAPASRPAPSTSTASKPAPSTSTTASAPASQPRQPASAPSPQAPARSGPMQWQWPNDGELLSRFAADNPSRRGIAIGGNTGDPVRAAEGGVVVYRGSGLTGYGNLLIVKHDDRWLSAYAHNEDMLVREGERVQRGQRIATMGATGTNRTQLHFEIRRDGQPVDPLTLLPRKS